MRYGDSFKGESQGWCLYAHDFKEWIFFYKSILKFLAFLFMKVEFFVFTKKKLDETKSKSNNGILYSEWRCCLWKIIKVQQKSCFHDLKTEKNGNFVK
jgi:hypothetical protein